jgi:hypothetical protein
MTAVATLGPQTGPGRRDGGAALRTETGGRADRRFRVARSTGCAAATVAVAAPQMGDKTPSSLLRHPYDATVSLSGPRDAITRNRCQARPRRLSRTVCNQRSAIAPLRTGFTSRIGVLFSASRWRTRMRPPWMAVISTVCSPIGFGRSGERELNTPVSGLFGSLAGGPSARRVAHDRAR